MDPPGQEFVAVNEVEVVVDEIHAEDAPSLTTVSELDPSTRDLEQDSDLPDDLLGPVFAAASGGPLGRQPLVESSMLIFISEPLFRLGAQLL